MLRLEGREKDRKVKVGAKTKTISGRRRKAKAGAPMQTRPVWLAVMSEAEMGVRWGWKVDLSQMMLGLGDCSKKFRYYWKVIENPRQNLKQGSDNLIYKSIAMPRPQ